MALSVKCAFLKQFQATMQRSCRKLTTPVKNGFGVCFDIDGVLIRGAHPIPTAAQALRKLTDKNGKFKVPACFVTNGLYQDQELADRITNLLGVQITSDQVVHSGTPLRLFPHMHKKRCVFMGQGNLMGIAKDLGFKNACTMDDISKTYPLLDVADHKKRKLIASYKATPEQFEPVEAIITLNEPAEWDKMLQLTLDLLMTSGTPEGQYDFEQLTPHIPFIGSNFDLIFMHQAHIPRFGHGSFLLCVESLFEKLTGKSLRYTAALGKPSEITFRFAEHQLHKIAKKIGYAKPLRTMYMIGDNPQSDIVGANLYQNYIEKHRHGIELPPSREMPPESSTSLTPQSVHNCHGLLVCTGIYKPPTMKSKDKTAENTSVISHSNKEFPFSKDMLKPSATLGDVLDAVEYILDRKS